MRGLIRLLVAIGIVHVLVLDPGSAHAQDRVTAAELLKKIGQLDGLRAHFREEKQLAMLVAPLVSEGTVYFLPPDRLIRVIRTPAWSSLEVRPGALIYADATGERRLPVAKDHPARAFVQTFVDVVRGDVESLERAFAIRTTGDHAGWTLTLTPRKPGSAGVRSIEISGADAAIRSLTVVETTGDRSVTTFDQLSTARPTAAEVAAALKRPR